MSLVQILSGSALQILHLIQLYLAASKSYGLAAINKLRYYLLGGMKSVTPAICDEMTLNMISISFRIRYRDNVERASGPIIFFPRIRQRLSRCPQFTHINSKFVTFLMC